MAGEKSCLAWEKVAWRGKKLIRRVEKNIVGMEEKIFLVGKKFIGLRKSYTAREKYTWRGKKILSV